MSTFEPLEPMVVLDFEMLKAIGRIPRSDEARKMRGLLVPLDDVGDRADTLVVFVSHRWLRSKAAHKAKFERLIVAGEILKRQFNAAAIGGTPQLKRLLLWMDWACIDQDDRASRDRGVASLPAYVEQSDVLLTPIPADRDAFQSSRHAKRWSSQSSELLDAITSSMYSLDREMLLRHAHARELFSRGWIRFEEFLGSHAPLPQGSFGWFERKGIRHRRDRPHFFCTPDLLAENFLLLLPRLVNSTLKALEPTEGAFRDESDRAQIRQLIAQLPPIPEDRFGYVGDFDKEGRRDGLGVETYPDGTAFSGRFDGGKPVEGVIEYPTGDRYEGTTTLLNERAAPAGMGQYLFADGDRYIGEFSQGAACGSGTMYYSRGNVCTGTWSGNAEDGRCIERFPDGAVYEGEFVRGNKHGRGCYQFASGERFSGTWHERKVHGWGEFKLGPGPGLRIRVNRGKPAFLRSLLWTSPRRLLTNWRKIRALAKRFPS